MRLVFKALLATTLLAAAAPAFAQEIVVTGERRSSYNDNSGGYLNNSVVITSRPVIVLKRTADYVVQTVRVVGDTRDATERARDLNAMVRNAIQSAAASGVELSIGDYVLQPLTLTNYTRLPITSDGRPDTSVTFFLAKVRLAPGMTLEAARKKIDDYVAGVAKVGRTSMQVVGSSTLSVVNPDQYRGQIIDLIAADAAASAAKFGAAYGVAVTGLDRPVEWARAGPIEVFLYLPAAYTVKRD